MKEKDTELAFIVQVSNDENFEQSSTMEATLTITKAKYDMSKVALNNVEKDNSLKRLARVREILEELRETQTE